MGQKVFVFRKKLVRHLLLAALMALFLSGCGSSWLNKGNSDSSSTIWKHRDEFVRIESQGAAAEKTGPNDHPARLSAEELKIMLSALDVQFEGKEPISLFTRKELDILGSAVSQGLAQAGPRQDVTFAVVGIHRGFVSFTHDRAVVTGRIFVQDGKLNLIIGKLHEEYDELEDRRVSPLTPGSRKGSLPLPQFGDTWHVIPMPGLETRTVANTDRYDWLVLTPDMTLWKAAIAEKKGAKETAKAAFQEASEVRETNAQLEAEQQQLRTEIQEMKQTIEAMKQAPAAAPAIAPAVAPAAAPAVSAPAATAPADLKKIEERLGVLQRIRDKGWITEQEFQAKKQEILDSL